MPFYLRDSISFGPFRINISNSGLGMSVGVKGFRLGTGPRGHYVHAGLNGVYYRKTLSGLGDRSSKKRKAEEAPRVPTAQPSGVSPTYMTEDGVLMRRIISGEAETMQVESRSEALSSLNEASEKVGLLLPTCFIGVALPVLFGMATESAPVVLTLAVFSTIVAIFAARADISRKNVVFAYQLDKKSESDYKELTASFDRLARSEGLWYVDASGDINNLTAWKRNAGATSLVNKHKTSVIFDAPPCVQSNVTPPSIQVDNKQLYFFPDCILVRQSKRYGSVSYGDLRLATRPTRFIVEDRVPIDCHVVGRTWKHPNKKGGPDRRFANNRELPICLFEELGMISSQGLKALIMASARAAITNLETALVGMRDTTHEAKGGEQILLSFEP